MKNQYLLMVSVINSALAPEIVSGTYASSGNSNDADGRLIVSMANMIYVSGTNTTDTWAHWVSVHPTVDLKKLLFYSRKWDRGRGNLS